ncbi:MAG: hypothetical protein IJY44_03070 [Bacteroidaceae bacterium]|nr:hypothetical protein [Bacteroidaceae bacterium]
MKKFYFMLVSLVLMVTTTNAQVNALTDLYGKYMFTATIEPTEAGADYVSVIKNNCEVFITKDDSGLGAPAVVKGLMGADYTQLVSDIDLENNYFYVNNPNPQYGLWEGYIGVTDVELENPQMYTMYYKYDPATKEITIDDFAVCGFSWPGGNMTATVYANVTNAKLTLIESETIEVPEIAGEWSFHPYSIDYVKDPSFVYEFKMNLVAKDETNMNWTATFNFEGYEPFTLDATFDGVELSIPFDNLYLDAENKIRFGIGATSSTPENVFVKAGKFSFTYSDKTLMWQGDRIYIRQEGTATEEVDGVEVTKDVAPIIQSITYGWIEREDPNAYDWSGTYKVKVGEGDVRYFDETAKLPSEFDIVVVADKGEYYVTDFLGYNMYESYLSDLKLVIGEDGKSASIEKGSIYLERDNDLVEGTLCIIYHNLVGAAADGSISLTLNEDGTFSLGSFSLVKHAMNTNDGSAVWEEDQTVARYKPLVINKAAEEEAPAFDWTGTYVLAGEVTKADAEDTTECPASFEVVVEYDEEGAYYCVMEIMGNDAWSINSGQFELTVAEDGKSATLNNGNVYSYGKGYFLKMFDANAQKNPVKVTLNDDNTLSIEDFSIVYGFYDDTELKTIAYYKNVTISKKDDADTSIEEVAADAAVEGVFDMQGRRIDEIAAPGLYIVNGKKVLVK